MSEGNGLSLPAPAALAAALGALRAGWSRRRKLRVSRLMTAVLREAVSYPSLVELHHCRGALVRADTVRAVRGRRAVRAAQRLRALTLAEAAVAEYGAWYEELRVLPVDHLAVELCSLVQGDRTAAGRIAAIYRAAGVSSELIEIVARLGAAADPLDIKIITARINYDLSRRFVPRNGELTIIEGGLV